jgi:glutathione peroxidase
MLKYLVPVLLITIWTNPVIAEAKIQNAYDFSFKSIDGSQLPIKSFKGKIVLVVNTASLCGFTRQYTQLQELYGKYKERGLVVLGVPSNSFGKQEPNSESDIKEFCEVNYNIEFPLTSKYSVKGEDAHPFYRWAEKELGPIAKPRWNFHKYLISSDGKLIDWFSTPTSPTSKRVIKSIESQLSKLN